jgi:leucine dehydrogenase
MIKTWIFMLHVHLGATVNDENLAKLKCAIIAGAANNQLANESVHGVEVMKKGIIYAPDFALNAGGVINCYSEVAGLPAAWALSKSRRNLYNHFKHRETFTSRKHSNVSNC